MAAPCDQLVDRRHVSLHPLVHAKPHIGSANSFGATCPTGRLAQKRPRKAKSRQLLIAEQKALRRHRGPQLRLISLRRSVRYRGHAPDQSRGNLPTKTKIVLALPSYNRQRLSVIRRGWCPLQTLCAGDRRGDPFRRRRSSPPVVECAGSIGGGSPSQAKQQQKKRLSCLRNPASAKASPAPPGARLGRVTPLKTLFYPGIIWAF